MENIKALIYNYQAHKYLMLVPYKTLAGHVNIKQEDKKGNAAYTKRFRAVENAKQHTFQSVGIAGCTQSTLHLKRRSSYR